MTKTSNRDNWNPFASYPKQKPAAVPRWSDSPLFVEFLSKPPWSIPIQDTDWDTALPLYSTLIFLEKTPPTATL
ncbi:hypothetical protein [Microcystis aeruginosa]|uniref:hypothetical protein n=1 Tax=Microcystis aeruginosa TaxID=1126 RepID=UPI00232FE199|nr:hypothetical protein [Microcystis aeruginosa]MDB9433477.1 hypothetical protein [Microcystis aeruginosa CS-552/01]